MPTTDISGIVAACGGGTARVTVNNNVDPAQEATQAIPSGGGTVTLTLPTPLALNQSQFLAVTLQGP